MSDLSDLAEELTSSLPIAARRVIDKALECGWELNKPGMTVALRLNHPTDELAVPVYVTWVVRRTPSDKIGFSFDSCGTRGGHSLRPAELLDYLEDPSCVYPVPEECSPEVPGGSSGLMRENRGWDDRATPAQNLRTLLGAEPIRIETEPGAKNETAAEIMARARQKMEESSQAKASQGRPSPARALRVSL